MLVKKTMFIFIKAIEKNLWDNGSNITSDVTIKEIWFEILDGDPHTKGSRPVLIKYGNKSYVVKFTDSRPYKILNTVLTYFANSLDTKMVIPNMLSSENNDWYMRPYLISKGQYNNHKITNFMYQLGIVTFTAYLLKMSDIHLENLICTEGTPSIIDAECMFYHFKDDTLASQLIRTGLVSIEKRLSSIIGGGKVTSLGLFIEKTGDINYITLKDKKENRIFDKKNRIIDPRAYMEKIISGFKDSYNLFIHNRLCIISNIQKLVDKDIRIRILLRYTRQYKVISDILNLPCHTLEVYVERLDIIRKDMEKTQGFFGKINLKTCSIEIKELLKGNVPYFTSTLDSDGVFCDDFKVGAFIGFNNTYEDIMNGDFFQFISQRDLSNRIIDLKNFLNETKIYEY